jgi:putative Mg2+ transporter-C (MgtC) family protein
MDFNIDLEIGLRLVISFALGAAIGLEREYNSKAAGLRTMIMICLGSTIFTEISLILGVANPDRIAANIVTGVGFLGAGVIFKDGLSVSGITTATTIWISAALGMAVGAGEYFIAVVSTGVIIIVLSAFNRLQRFVEKIHQIRTYKISIPLTSENPIEGELQRLLLSCVRKKNLKEGANSIFIYEVSGSEKKLDAFSLFLTQHEKVIAFEY